MENRPTPLLAILAGLFLTVGLFAACGDEPLGPAAGESFSLVPGERITLEPTGTHVRFLQVASDSRCPLQAYCVWAGDAEVLLEIAPRDGDPVEETLHTDPGTGPQRVVLDRYELVLLDLRPYPEVPGGIATKDYRVVLVLQERAE